MEEDENNYEERREREEDEEEEMKEIGKTERSRVEGGGGRERI